VGVRASKKTKIVISPGMSVRVPVPQVDRAKSDQRNILAVIMEANGDTFKLGTKVGRLDSHYTANQFDPCQETFLNMNDVPLDKIVSLREAAGLLSVGGQSQGFIKCSCRKVCSTNCKCVKMNAVCNSECHKNLSCNNYFRNEIKINYYTCLFFPLLFSLKITIGFLFFFSYFYFFKSSSFYSRV